MDVLWLPGTDHAGIATQTGREAACEGRHDAPRSGPRGVPRARVWAGMSDNRRRDHPPAQKARRVGRLVARALHAGRGPVPRRPPRIRDALSRTGSSTATRMVNWCPRCRTALSDIEVDPPRARPPSITSLPARRRSGGTSTVATTRPETMLGDTAVAVHPDDERYRAPDRQAASPAAHRPRACRSSRDAFVDPEFGTGVVKVTPAHDPNDFEMGKRHGLPDHGSSTRTAR